MEKHLIRQQIVAESIRKVAVNFKKDSAKRKTPDYIKKRLDALEDLWSEFELTNTVLAASEDQTDDYFTTLAYNKVKQDYETIRKLLSEWQPSTTEEAGVMSKGDELITQQSTNFRAFMRVIRQIHISDLKERWELEDKLQMLQARWKTIDDLHWQIDNLLIGADITYEQEYTDHEKVFESTKRELNHALNATKHRHQSVPQIEIPTFSGSYTQWPTFMDLFSEAIHNNNQLTRGQKMQHLKGKLKGEAERLVQHLNVSADNYDTCWEILTHRYNNLQLLFTKQIHIFMNQSTVQQQTAFEIKRLHDVSLETIHAIHNLGVDTTTWDPILVHILTGKLDPETYTSYMEVRKSPRDLPTFDEFITFLENKFTALEPVKKPKLVPAKQTNTPTKEFALRSPRLNKANTYSAQADRKCPLCKTHHLLAYCRTFGNMTPETKLKTMKQLHVCQNCMYSHNGKDCTSNKTCKTCGKQHHTILHDVFVNCQQMLTNEIPASAMSNVDILQRNVNHANGNWGEVLLATVQLKIMAGDGTYHLMRCLLDQGSQISLITESAAQRLGLPRRKQNATVLGVGISSNQSHGTVQLVCGSLYSDYKFTTDALVMKKVINNLPNYSFEKQTWPHLHNLNLADPQYNISGPVDILLGASVYAEIVLGGILRGSPDSPIAQQTKMGWVLLGNMVTLNCYAVLNNLDEISLFWESEEITENESANMTSEEHYCETLYQETTIRLPNGRYQVRLPMKRQFEQNLGASKSQAVAQFRHLEKRLTNNNTLSDSYKNFIQEYLSLGHMKLSTLPTEPSCFLPHHGVLKLDSTTTKLRVVFNASAKTTSGYSLNELMESGPNLQQDLQSLILRWRTYEFVYTADIEKFFRQIHVSEEDQSLQKIVWRDDCNKTIEEYQLCTITYGTKAAPYLAMRTIKQLVQDDGHQYPLAAEVLSHQVYTDDILGGCNLISEACDTQTELIKMLSGGGFTLRKWASNNPKLLENLPQELISQNMFDFKQAETNKTLGIKWNPCTDHFTFNHVIDQNNNDVIITKRSLLSELSKLYDPQGWLSPVTVKAKIIFQQVWSSGATWDEPLPEKISEEWRLFREKLPCIKNITIARWVGDTQKPTELHGFCDASEKAYGCVIYCKTTDENNKTVIQLLVGKTKLVPMKKRPSLPRLELCAALLLSRLMKKVTDCINVQTYTIYAWTDSMVTLGWLRGDACRWKTYVANRVRLITTIIPESCWKYVNTMDNPADCASRGLSPSRLPMYSLWWEGPTWLKTNDLPNQLEHYSTNEEVKKIKVNAVQTHATLIVELLNKHSSMVRVIRVLCWIIRVANIYRRKVQSTQKTLCIEEMLNAHNIIIKTIQNICFEDDITRLQNGQRLRSTSKILSLNPRLDEHGLLRVGGRLAYSNLNEWQKHPIILPSGHRLTELLIQQAHLQTLHGGARLTLTHLRNKYWLIGGMRCVKKQLIKCVKCHRFKHNQESQLMADLPEPRVTQSRPFTHTGVDFTGRVTVKANKGRGIKTTSGYIAIFVCLCSKAIHLELVSDLSTNTFIAALKRLCSRRGTPSHMYSDNGTNFVGAARTLRKEYKEVLQHYVNRDTFDYLAVTGIQWHFNSPAWPSAGGLWEAAVKSMKHHLKRVLGEQKLTYEEFTTLLIQIEACLNSRPLIAITEDTDDLACLTPGHFLVGGPLLAPPQITGDDNIGLSTRWKLTTKMFRDFWKKWSSDYLQTLQPRGKWHHNIRNLEVGDIVLVKEDNVPPSCWILGRVIETHPGADGRVRVVTLETKNSTLKRPVVKLSRLPLERSNPEPTETLADPEVPETKEPRRRKKTSFFNYLCLFLMFVMGLTICAGSPTEQFGNITNLDRSKLIYFDKIADMNVIQEEWTMVVYYNMTAYWQSTKNIEKYISHLQGLYDAEAADLTIATQLQHEIDELKHYNDMLQSEHGRRTRGLIDGVGYVANTLFGVLDERFATKYRKDIKALQDNDDHLVNLYKRHTTIIEGEYNMLRRNEEVMNKQFSAISEHLKSFDIRARSEHQRIMYFTKSVLAANMIISNLHRIQQVLLDLVTDVRNGRMDTHLLRPDEFQQQLNIISRQIPNDLSVPCIGIDDHHCIQQMYKLSRVHMRLIEEFLIFEVKLPLVSNEQYELSRLIPIPTIHNGTTTKIIPTADYLAVNLKKDLLFPLTSNDVTSCEHLNEHQLICSLTSPIYNIKGTSTSALCEVQIINNEQISNCKIANTDCNEEWLQLHNKDAWLFSCCEECSVRIFCPAGIKSLTLQSTGIVTLAEGCILKGDNILIHAHNNLVTTLKINRDFDYLPESGVNHIINSSTYVFKSEGHSEQLNLIKNNLEFVKVHQDELQKLADRHESHHYGIYGGLLLTGIIIGAIGILRLRKHLLQNRLRVTAEPGHDDNGTPQGNVRLNSDSNSTHSVSMNNVVDKATSPSP